jgi:hypothetical protein
MQAFYSISNAETQRKKGRGRGGKKERGEGGKKSKKGGGTQRSQTDLIGITKG